MCVTATSPVTIPERSMTPTRIGIALAVGALLASARSIRSQPNGGGPDRPPTTFELGATSVGEAAGGALVGGLAGFAVDGAYCQRHHGKDPSFLFGPCFLYVRDASAIGWFGGTVVGATWGAVRVAEKRGCPRQQAVMRSVLGSMIGLASGAAVILAPSSGKYPPARSMFTLGAPLLSGIAAAIAVRGCRGP
jgi:hypothetical protein